MPGEMARSDPRPSVWLTRGAGSGQHLASVLQEGRENANIDATEKWPVGVTAHHLAGGLEEAAGSMTGLASGTPPRGNFTMAMLDQMNA